MRKRRLLATAAAALGLLAPASAEGSATVAAPLANVDVPVGAVNPQASSKTSLEEQIAALRIELAEIATRIQAYTAQDASLRDQIAKANAELEIRRTEVAATQARVRDAALTSYVSQVAPNREFFTELNETVVAEALLDTVHDRGTDHLAELALAQTELNAAVGHLDALKAESDALGAQLDAESAETNARLESKLGELGVLLKALEEARKAEEARQAEQARKAQAAAATAAASARTKVTVPTATPAGPKTTVVVSGSGWLCPVAGPSTFIDSWGFARAGGRGHQGVDMMAPQGTPTVAPVGGTLKTRNGGIGGLSWRLEGDDGAWYYGAHLSAFGAPGGRVEAGTIIGYVGNTGDAAGGAPHLHFEYHPNGYGTAINPYPKVAAACR